MTRRTTLLTASLLVAAFVPTAAFADEPNGEKIFKAKCTACHGGDGKGKTTQGTKMKIADMTSPAWKKEFPADKIKGVVETGVSREKDGVKQEMKPLKDKLTPEQIAAVADYASKLK